MSAKDPPIDLLPLMMVRLNKERSRALPAFKYGNPENYIEFDRVATKGDQSMDMKEQFDEIDYALHDWAEWMRRPEPPQGYPSRSAGMLAPTWIKDSEELYEAADVTKIEATNAAIDSLKTLSRLAINVRFGLSAAVWRFNEHNGLYETAKKEIAPLLRRRSVI